MCFVINKNQPQTNVAIFIVSVLLTCNIVCDVLNLVLNLRLILDNNSRSSRKKICILCQLRFERICLPDMSVVRTLVSQRSVLEEKLYAISLALNSATYCYRLLCWIT